MRFAKTAELSLFALTTGMPRRDAARIFYQICGASLALAYPIILYPTSFLYNPYSNYREAASLFPLHVLCVARCTMPYPTSALYGLFTKPWGGLPACFARVEGWLRPAG